jgi:hypothetical protein
MSCSSPVCSRWTSLRIVNIARLPDANTDANPGEPQWTITA